ncbi:hypothetical protein V5P93_005143 [Actinokineospora auranticolor]|uniref:hypothetical protein n=1 Tax=Actinokineospora auranticolor TaxID=155976 RepID=UPI0011B0BCFB|nr:hypothetical protein [Actinokineospora auranticolor]
MSWLVTRRSRPPRVASSESTAVASSGFCCHARSASAWASSVLRAETYAATASSAEAAPAPVGGAAPEQAVAPMRNAPVAADTAVGRHPRRPRPSP